MASNLNAYKGYHRRQDGSAFRGLGGQRMNVCPICGAPMQLAVGFERNYPQDPDLFVCTHCADLLIEMENGGKPPIFSEHMEFLMDDTKEGIGGFRTPFMDALDATYQHMVEREQEELDAEMELLRAILSGSSVQFMEQGVLHSEEAQSYILLLSRAINRLSGIPKAAERYNKIAAIALQGAMMFQYCLYLLKKYGVELKMPEEMTRILKEYDSLKDAEIESLKKELEDAKVKNNKSN